MRKDFNDSDVNTSNMPLNVIMGMDPKKNDVAETPFEQEMKVMESQQ